MALVALIILDGVHSAPNTGKRSGETALSLYQAADGSRAR